MPSPGRPTRFSVEQVVAQQLNLVFGTSKPVQKESVTTQQKSLSYHQCTSSCLVEDEEIGEVSGVKRKLTLL
jgi:hypothetical protein